MMISYLGHDNTFKEFVNRFRHIGLLIITVVCMVFCCVGCANAMRTQIVGKRITQDNFKDFYYTYQTTVNPPDFQRYRFYKEDGKTYFYHEKREGDSVFLTEEDITVSGTRELTGEEWNTFWKLIDGGGVIKRKEYTTSGGSGPWLFLYWDGDKDVCQEFSFKEYDNLYEFEAFCERLVEQEAIAMPELARDEVSVTDDIVVTKDNAKNLNAHIRTLNKLVKDELERYAVGYMCIDYIELDNNSKELCPELAKSLDEFNEIRKKNFDEASVSFAMAANKYNEEEFEAAEDADTCVDYEYIRVMRADNVAMSMLVSYEDFWGDEVDRKYEGVTYDSQTGKRLEIYDVVDTDKYRNAIDSELKRKYDKVSMIDFDPLEYKGWVLTPEGIIVHFTEDNISIPKGGDAFVQINFDEYPEAFNEKYCVTTDEYAIPFYGKDIFYIDTEGTNGEREAVVYSPLLYDEKSSQDEYCSYEINVDGKCYSNFDEDWFYGYKTYYVHTQEGSFIYTNIEGYDKDYIIVNKFYGEEPVCIEKLPGMPFYAENLDDEDDALVRRSIAFTNPAMIYDALSFENNVCGTYQSQEDDELESRYWDILSLDGKYYLDCIGEYDFTAAEIELLDTTPYLVDGELRYMVKVYPFSGFAFAGEYQGGGEVMYISSKIDSPRKQIQLSSDNPFFDTVLCMNEAEGINLHRIQDTHRDNSVAPWIVGAWRSVVNIEGEETNIFMQFLEDGRVDIVRKCECYPPDVYRGIYSLEEKDGRYIGKIEAEELGMGSQPMADWILEYDPASDTPITIKDENLDFSPLAYGVDDLMLSKTESGANDRYIHPGPYDRTDEVVKKYDEYNLSNESDGFDFESYNIESIINTAVELTNGTSYISYGIQNKNNGGAIWIKILKDVYPSIQATRNWVRYDIGESSYYDIYDRKLGD